MNYLFLSFLTLSYLNFVFGNLSFNAQCNSKNLNGRCVDIDTCKPYAVAFKDLPDRHEYFPICNSNLRYICCPMPPGGLDVTTSSSREPKKLVDPEERISTKMCREYLGSIQSRISTRSGECMIDLKYAITGGIEADVHEFPHQALIGYKFTNGPVVWKCGGSLLSPYFVLTASHCVPRHDLHNYVIYVKLGMHSRLEIDESTSIYQVVEIINHPDAKNQQNDLALLRTGARVTFNQNVYPICLANEEIDESTAIATGFGHININEQLPDNMQKVKLEKFSNLECLKRIPALRTLRMNMDSILCYGHREEIRDVCKGDSGGPLQIRSEDKVPCSYTQIGGVSFGVQGCGVNKTPSVYFKIYHYLDWIEGHVWPNQN